MKIVTVFGARPQFIKAAPVSRAIKAMGLIETLVHTGQHYDAGMSDIFFEELSLPQPAYNLGVGSGSHGEQTGRMLAAIEGVLLKERPDIVLIYGDTNSTLAGALAAAKLDIPVGHVEAGLRSFNRKMPEEINRIVADSVSSLLFAPTETAVAHLRREGVDARRIHLVGDVMYDAALMFADRARERSRILADLKIAPKQYALATVHRAENTDNADLLTGIFGGLADVCSDLPVICPLHPRTAGVLSAATRRAFEAVGGQIVPPLSFLDMVFLEQNAAVILTDSGGVQKEAFFHQVPCVTLRNETEWTELVESGWNRLLPPAEASRLREVVRDARASRGRPVAPYGDAHAAEKIAAVLAAAGAKS